MKSNQRPPLKTRERLLVTASRIFAEKGYQEATVAEICEQAETNIASVNYHFRDKESLYLEAWRYAFQQDMLRHPVEASNSDDITNEARLTARIRALIARIADPDAHFFAIVHREMAQQSSLLEKIMVTEINPERHALIALLTELLGPTATEQQVQFCHASIIGQCFHLLKVKHLRLSPETQRYVISMTDAEAYAEHVVKFSLAGIAAIRIANEHANSAL